MSRRTRTRDGTGLATTQPVFGAFSANDELVLVVEANDAEAAASRVAQVVVLVSLTAEHPLRVSKLDVAPGGVPIFFDGYFAADEDGYPLRRVGPSSRSIQ